MLHRSSDLARTHKNKISHTIILLKKYICQKNIAFNASPNSTTCDNVPHPEPDKSQKNKDLKHAEANKKKKPED